MMNGKSGSLKPRTLVVILAFLLTAFATNITQAQQYTRHTVRSGESLLVIGLNYGTTWQEIAALNNITNPNRIYVGQVLLIPPSSRLPRVIGTYTVGAGDTLWAIAQRYGTTIDDLVAVNAITSTTRLSIGQVLNISASTIPSAPQTFPPTPVPTPAPVTPPASGSYHVVRYGDTMFRISAQYGVNVYALAETNGILNLNRIYAGQILRIPGR